MTDLALINTINRLQEQLEALRRRIMAPEQVQEPRQRSRSYLALRELQGMWRDRKIENPVAYQRRIREEADARLEHPQDKKAG